MSSTSPGVQSSVCVRDRVALNARLTDIKYMTVEKATRNPLLSLGLSTRLRPFAKWSKSSMGSGLFGNIGKCFTIPNCLMCGNG